MISTLFPQVFRRGRESLQSGFTDAHPSHLSDIQEDLDFFLNERALSERDAGLTTYWSQRAALALERLVGADGKLKRAALENFRRDQVLVTDLPTAEVQGRALRHNALSNVALGWRRATIRCLRSCLAILEQRGYASYLRRHPCHPAGNPVMYGYKGYRYTFRWARHIYFLGLLKRVLGDRLPLDAIFLDIGSAYGIFSSLLKAEYPHSTHILVDFPLQLITARYFLSQRFPGARIAGVHELRAEPVITRKLISQYDFVLIPPTLFERLQARSADIVVNFGALCEVSRETFDGYVHSPPLTTSHYLFMVDRIQAKPELHDDLTILDFPIWDTTKKLHFDICPMYSVDFSFQVRRTFFTKYYIPPPYFEYIGRT